jgi:hypothetical protein
MSHNLKLKEILFSWLFLFLSYFCKQKILKSDKASSKIKAYYDSSSLLYRMSFIKINLS